VLPESAFIINTRLLMLFEAGRYAAVPFRTDVRSICMRVLKRWKIFFAKLQFVLDFLTALETNAFKF
jgi:hypothetical protein